MIHLQVQWDTKGITGKILAEMTRKEFAQCDLPHYMKVSLMNQYYKANR